MTYFLKLQHWQHTGSLKFQTSKAQIPQNKMSKNREKIGANKKRSHCKNFAFMYQSAASIKSPLVLNKQGKPDSLAENIIHTQYNRKGH